MAHFIHEKNTDALYPENVGNNEQVRQHLREESRLNDSGQRPYTRTGGKKDRYVLTCGGRMGKKASGTFNKGCRSKREHLI